MSLQDRYGNDLATPSAAARDAYLAGVDSLMAATPGMDSAFQRAVEADETFALGHISLARAKQLLGRGHEAKAPLARAKELAGDASPREQSQIAIFEKILTGQGAAALEAIREHMKDWPRDAMALAPATSVFGLIGFSGKPGREADQLALLEPFEKHYGDDWWYRTQLAFAQIELQKLDEGQRNIDAALAAFPKSAHAAHIRGHLFYELGEREAGLAFLQDWMKDYPREGLMHVHNNWHLALWSMETGQMEQAWRLYDEALPPLPGAPRSMSRPTARPSWRAPRWPAKRASRSGGASWRTTPPNGSDGRAWASSTCTRCWPTRWPATARPWRSSRKTPRAQRPTCCRRWPAASPPMRRATGPVPSARSNRCSPRTSAWAAAARNATCSNIW